MEQPHSSDAHKITLADQLVNPRQYQAIGKCNNKAILPKIPAQRSVGFVGNQAISQNSWLLRNSRQSKCVLHQESCTTMEDNYPRFTKLIIADIMEKYESVPKRLEVDYQTIKYDTPLVNMYTTREVTVRGMLILDDLLTDWYVADIQEKDKNRSQNDKIEHENGKTLSKEKSTVSSLQEEKKKLKSDFIIREGELLDKQIQLENKIKELDNILIKTGQSIQTMHMLSPKPDSFYHTEQKIALGYQNPFYLKHAQQKEQSLYNGKVLLEKHDQPVLYDSEETLELA
ncbi:hypothetical protein Tco_0998244 [Tanacetum coccineum]